MAHEQPPPTSKDASTQGAIDHFKERVCRDDPDWYAAYTFELEADWEECGCESQESRNEALQQAAEEIQASDWDEPPPPGVAREPVCRGAPIYQFVWQSKFFGKLMFLRFAIHKDGNVFVISIHPARHPKKRGSATRV